MKVTTENIKIFKENYNPEDTVRGNQERLKKAGLSLAFSTVVVWSKLYLNEEIEMLVPKELVGQVREFINQKLKGKRL